MKRLRVLAIETSCDETSVAILEVGGKSVKLRHHETATQIPIHARYGGVVPEVAARTHVAELVSLLERAKAFSLKPSFDAIAVTRGPGLATALRVGLEAGRTIAATRNFPIVGVNHLEGHLASTWLVPENRKDWKFPILFLLVSGGHSELILMKDFGSYRVLGRTRDDASGEAFDKTAKLMGLSYPGGPALAKLAENGDPTAFDLPRPMIADPTLDMSFSGLKTAVRNVWEKLPPAKQKNTKVRADLAASIQAAIIDVLISKTMKAARKSRPTAIAIVGGVSANTSLQIRMAEAVEAELTGVKMFQPAKGFHTDNAAMIAAAGVWRLLAKPKGDDWKRLSADPELDF
jgi:N6-L-threonylcarbamoyladenine synthase